VDGPYVTGGGGKRVSSGYETTFTGPEGKVTIAYTQISGAYFDGGSLMQGMVFTLAANPSKDSMAIPRMSVALHAGEVDSVKALAGRTFDDFDAMKGRVFDLFVVKDRGGVARSAKIEIVSATDEAVEGTFTAEVYESPFPDAQKLFSVTDGRFKAYPAQVVTKEMLRGLSKPR
jgi:hypothetical protein